MKRRTTLKAGVALTGLLVVPNLIAKENRIRNTIDDSIFEVIKSRRSVRKFKSDPIPEEDLKKILDAARMAPASGNQQPWKLLVIQDRKSIDGLRELCIQKSIDRFTQNNNPNEEELENRKKRSAQYYGDYLSAPVYVVILTDNNSQYPSIISMMGLLQPLI